MGWVAGKLRQLQDDTSGAVAIVLAVMGIPLFLAAGVAIDYAEVSRVKAKLQSAADAAVLAAAAPKKVTDSERKTIAVRFFEANVERDNLGAIATPNVTVTESSVKISVDTQYPARFMRIAGFTNHEIGANSTAFVPGEKKAELALVLDYSGSMNSKGKYQAMRDAAINMIDILTDDGTKTDTLKFGLVPFSHHVYLSLPGEHVAGELAGTTWTNCTQDRKYPYNVEDSVPDPSNVDTLWGMTTGNGYGRGAYSQCGPYLSNNLIVKPLTNNANEVKAQLLSMSPHSLTHIALGTEFGWALLSPGAPFTEGAPYTDEDTKKYLVVLTDGVQTQDAWGPGKWRSREIGEANLEEMCTNIKAEGITIITIAFDLSDLWTEQRLKNCASSPDDFHDADGNAQLAASFEAIANKLYEQVRILK